jgi:hypothetical protein
LVKSSLRKFYGRHQTWLTVMEYLCHKWPRIGSTCRKHFSVWVHPSFSGVRVARSLVLYLCSVDRFLSFCTFSFGHCVVCSSSICGFWLALCYLQTLQMTMDPFHFT